MTALVSIFIHIRFRGANWHLIVLDQNETNNRTEFGLSALYASLYLGLKQQQFMLYLGFKWEQQLAIRTTRAHNIDGWRSK